MLNLKFKQRKSHTDGTIHHGIAKDFIKKYTGQDDLDAFQDFVIVVFVLCQDMYDNRAMYVDSTNLNYVIESILGMHSVNLIPEEST